MANLTEASANAFPAQDPYGAPGKLKGGLTKKEYIATKVFVALVQRSVNPVSVKQAGRLADHAVELTRELIKSLNK